jgi:hypothetical protein
VALVVAAGAVAVVPTVVDVVELWHELPGHGLPPAEAPGVTRTAVAPTSKSIVRNEKMAAILDKAAALQVEWNVVPCHRRPTVRLHPQIEAAEARIRVLEGPEGV